MGTQPEKSSEYRHNSSEAPIRRMVAVIDMGATSARMAIAQIDPDRTVHHLDKLTQAVNLGRDTFTKGEISRETTELCVQAIFSFQHVLREYDIRNNDQIRAVATNAIREASNRQYFLDRIYIATGIDIEVIEETEATRFTYLGVQPILEQNEKIYLLRPQSRSALRAALHRRADSTTRALLFQLI